MHVRWFIVASLMLTASGVAAQTPSPEGLKFFEQKIRPVLVQHCYACHSDEAAANKKLKGGLRLDSAEGMLNGGDTGPSLVKGKAADSLIVKALKFDDMEMPPSGALSEEIIADFVAWIDTGAPDPRQGVKSPVARREINIDEGRKFWSFRPLAGVAPPAHRDIPTSAGPIDCFIRAKQIENGITPNVPAGKEKLIRRAYFDLIGLPPTPAQVAAFVQDNSQDAFAKVVDSLLADDHYGERWARHWLDAARYAESGGYEFDKLRPGAYHYRDWVIRAFNSDLPYDEFARMQLAGDLIRPHEYEGVAAAGFLVAGPYPGQITSKTVERIRYDQLDDMIMTIGGSMLGLTLGCVRCHDHKFDPISQQDYYGIAACLGHTVQGTRPFDRDPEATRQAQEKHRAEHEQFVSAVKNYAATELPESFAAWQKDELPKQPDAPRWHIFDPVEVEALHSYFKTLPSGIIVYGGSNDPVAAGRRRRDKRGRAPAADEYRIKVHTHQKNITALRLDAFLDKSLPQRGPGLAEGGGFQLAELTVTATPLDPAATDPPVKLKLKGVFVGSEDEKQPLAQAVDGKPNTAWVVKANVRKDNAAIFEIESGSGSLGFASGTQLLFEFKFRDRGLGRFRLSMSIEQNPATWAGDFATQHLGELRAILAANDKQLPASLQEEAVQWFSPFNEEAGKVYHALREHAASVPRGALTEVYTTVAGGQDVYLLRRGEIENKAGKAEPGFIQVLERGAPAATDTAAGGIAAGDDDSAGDAASGDAVAGEKTSSEKAASEKPSGGDAVDPRLRLARWMTDLEHGAGPLLARVIVNRLWQHHFGEGLVGTPNDFGAQGEPPTHPELLDWLAGELIREGWRLKPLHRRIMLSQVYQQSEQADPANVQADPSNSLLWHHRPRRLEAEVIRDALLAVGGTLDTEMYGPSVLDNVPRRSIYLRVKRSELIPLMTMFDVPEPTQSIGERISTTVPTQALVLMNSPFVRQQAEKFAERVCSPDDSSPAGASPAGASPEGASHEGASHEGASHAGAVDRAYQIAFARLPTDAERRRMLAFIDEQRTIMSGDGEASADRALVEFCHVLLCLNEFLYVD